MNFNAVILEGIIFLYFLPKASAFFLISNLCSSFTWILGKQNGINSKAIITHLVLNNTNFGEMTMT